MTAPTPQEIAVPKLKPLTEIQDPRDRLANRLDRLARGAQRSIAYWEDERERIAKVYVNAERKAIALAKVDARLETFRAEATALAAEIDVVVDMVLFPSAAERPLRATVKEV
jgi:hypothetical protein